MAAPTLTPTGIRTDLVTRLKGATAAGQRVYDSRQIDLPSDELPAVVVTSTGGTEERGIQSGLVHKRTERVQITGVVKGTSDAALASALDTLEAAILDRLIGDSEWLRAFDALPRITTEKNLDIAAETSAAGVGIALELEYHVAYSPLTAPASLKMVAIDTESDEPAGADVSERVVNLTGG